MQKKSREFQFTDSNLIEELNAELKNHKKVHNDFLKALKSHILTSTMNANTSLKMLYTRYPKKDETTSLKIYFILHSVQWDEPLIQDVMYSENIFQSQDVRDEPSKSYHQYLQLMYKFYEEHGFHPTSRNILSVFTQNHTTNLAYIRGLLKQVQEAIKLDNQLKINKKIQEQILNLLAQDVRRLVKIFISLFKVIIHDYNAFNLEQREVLLVITVNFPKLHGPIEKLFKKCKIKNSLENALLNTQKVIGLMEMPIAHHIKDWTDQTTSKELNSQIVQEIEKLGWTIGSDKVLPSKSSSTSPISEWNLNVKNRISKQKTTSSTSSSDNGGYSRDRRLSGRSDSFADSDTTSSNKLHRNVTQRPSIVFERPRECAFDEKDDSSSRSKKVGDQPFKLSVDKVKSFQRRSSLSSASSTENRNNSTNSRNITSDDADEEMDRKMTTISITSCRDENRVGFVKKQYPIDGRSPFDRMGPQKNEMKYADREYRETEKKKIVTPFDDDVPPFQKLARISNQARRDPFGPYESEGSGNDEKESNHEGYDLQDQRCMNEFEMGTEESQFHPEYDDEQDNYLNQFPQNYQKESHNEQNYQLQAQMGAMSAQYAPRQFEPLSSRFSRVKSNEKLGSFGNLPAEQKQEYYGENEWTQQNQQYHLQQQSLNNEFYQDYKYDSEEYTRNHFQMNQNTNSGFHGFSER